MQNCILLRSTFSIFVELTILHLFPSGFPGNLMTCADAISHIVDFYDWYTTPEFFTNTWTAFGAHIHLTGSRMLPTPIFPDSILGFAYPALKLLTHFQSRGMERTIG